MNAASAFDGTASQFAGFFREPGTQKRRTRSEIVEPVSWECFSGLVCRGGGGGLWLVCGWFCESFTLIDLRLMVARLGQICHSMSDGDLYGPGGALT